jgi:DNA-binding IclR family transcriptional regulator
MDEKNIIGSVVKAVDVLRALSREPYEFTANEISKITQLNRSTVHRLLSTLVHTKMVVQDEVRSKYMIGPMAYRLGISFKQHFDSDDKIKTIINEVAKELSMNVGYSIKNGLDIISFYETESYSDVIFGYKIGARWPITRGASARAVLAFHHPFSEVENLIRSTSLVRKTPYTITDHTTLINAYKKTKELGYAMSDQESIIGAIGIGYPVRNIHGEVVSTISVAAIKASLPESRIPEILEALRQAAHKIQPYLI